jgi:hypothetical protein
LPVGTRIVTLLTGRQGTVREQSDYRSAAGCAGETHVRFADRDLFTDRVIHGRVLVRVLHMDFVH